MRLLKRIICAALASAVMVCALGSCSEEKITDIKSIELTDEQLAEVKSNIDAILDEADFSGGVYVKLNKNSIYEKYTGVTDESGSEKVSTSTKYQVSSLTKNITAICVLQLSEQGKLDLEAPLSDFFDAKKDRAYLKNVAVNDLLSNETAFGSYNSELMSSKKALNKLIDTISIGGSVKDYITNYILDRGIEHGGSTTHSNYYLLGLIIEKASGEKYEEYIRKNIFEKLEMNDTEPVSNDSPLSGYNVTKEEWRTERKNPLYNDFGFMFSSFGLCSTLEDMRKFYEAVLENSLTESDLTEKVESFNSDYGCGFRHDGHNLYAYGGTSLHTTFTYINPETEQLTLLCSNHSGKTLLDVTGKAVYNAVNSKINGILLDSGQG